jgi:LmbE family N-acetylglucosaminyl deacetylase
LTLLFVGAHCDDIEIGCGATIVRLAREHNDAKFVWGVFSRDPEREAESRAAARRLLAGVASELYFFDFQDRFFPSESQQIKQAFDGLKSKVDPDVIFTHHLEDRHQDHKTVGELTWNTFRNNLILEYEIPKYEGDLGRPNLYIPLDTADIEMKSSCLMECFPSQRKRSWFTADTFSALARLRGIESGAPSGFAEAFHARKVCL